VLNKDEKMAEISEDIKYSNIRIDYLEKLKSSVKEKEKINFDEEHNKDKSVNDDKNLTNKLNAVNITLSNYAKNMVPNFYGDNCPSESKLDFDETKNVYSSQFLDGKIVMLLQQMEIRIKKMEITNHDYIINEFVKYRNIQRGDSFRITINDILADLDGWYKEKYFTNCTCVFDELLIRYFLVNGYNITYPPVSRYWRHYTIGLTMIDFLTYNTA